MSQEMFDLALPEPKVKAGRGEGVKATKEKAATDSEKVVWKRITTVSRPKCDVCIQRMEHGAPWFAPDPVAYERLGHGTQVFLCYFHAAPLRAGEGLET